MTANGREKTTILQKVTFSYDASVILDLHFLISFTLFNLCNFSYAQYFAQVGLWKKITQSKLMVPVNIRLDNLDYV